ncbi:MAG: hypothetical protein KDB27_35065 [Planctomycetales bacterium]|nr:hypothetical protein [Planctomycetales bacterium]
MRSQFNTSSTNLTPAYRVSVAKRTCIFITAMCGICAPGMLIAQVLTTSDPAAAGATNESSSQADGSDAPIEKKSESKPAQAQNGLIRLSKEHEVWVDKKNKRVILGGTIAFRKGLLEMFACIKNTKEHESIVAVNSKAYLVHAALLALGAKNGSPVQYDPAYVPASGAKVKVEVVWKDKDGKERRCRAQELIRDLQTKKPMQYDWVFAGSYFWTDQETGKNYYQAEGGELICVSNFSTATMDLPVESSASSGQLLFEAATEKIPPLGTKVRLILTPDLTWKRSEPSPQPKVPERGAESQELKSGADESKVSE